MHFNEALRVAAHRLGLAGRPDARLCPWQLPIALGAVLMVLSGFGCGVLTCSAPGCGSTCAVFALAGCRLRTLRAAP